MTPGMLLFNFAIRSLQAAATGILAGHERLTKINRRTGALVRSARRGDLI